MFAHDLLLVASNAGWCRLAEARLDTERSVEALEPQLPSYQHRPPGPSGFGV